MKYLINKHGAGGSHYDQIVKRAVAEVNKTGRSYNTTMQNGAMNARLLTTNVNTSGERYYPVSSTLSNNFESTAGE